MATYIMVVQKVHREEHFPGCEGFHARIMREILRDKFFVKKKVHREEHFPGCKAPSVEVIA
jgi:hypothetical protein